jgi:hypothetical protein
MKGTKVIAAIALICLASCNANIPQEIFDSMQDKPIKEQFKLYYSVYGKQNEYDLNSEVGIRRFKAFKKSVKLIKEHNSIPNQPYTLGITAWSDVPDEDIYPPLQTYEVPEHIKGLEAPLDEVGQVYDSVDHSTRFSSNFVMSTTCTAWGPFAVTAALEAAYNIETGTKKAFSPQGLINCLSDACQSGSNIVIDGYKNFFKNQWGVFSDAELKYVGTQSSNSCKTGGYMSPYSEGFWYGLNWGTPKVRDIVDRLKRGPYTFISGTTLDKNYKTGILSPVGKTQCGSGYYLSVVIGYGVENGVEYFLIRSPFGSTVGYNGNIKLKRADNYWNYGIGCYQWRPAFY